MTYQSDLKKHLSDYKKSRLGIQEPGCFEYRGRSIPCEHILPLAEGERNLFDEARPAATAFFKNCKQHKYFHHLNSSQAFAFNLFCPYFSGGDAQAASALLRALGQRGELLNWAPEAIPDPDEGTNIDVTWITSDGWKTLCEVKLAETEFGKAKNDADHRNKFKQIYAPTLSSHLKNGSLEQDAFFAAYQIFRNVWHMVQEETYRLMFLLPRANKALWLPLVNALSTLKQQTNLRVSIVAIEDVFAALSSDPHCPEQYRHYAIKLAEKYLPRAGRTYKGGVGGKSSDGEAD